MTTRSYTNEQILAILCQADLGVAVRDVCAQHGISERTYQRWRARLVAGRCTLAQRLQDLEVENTRLWRLLEANTDFVDTGASPLSWPQIQPPSEPEAFGSSESSLQH